MRLSKLFRWLIVLAVMTVYLGVLQLGMTEENRRSLVLTSSSTTGDDDVTINVQVTSIDTARGMLNQRIRLIPSGRFALDRGTPAVDLKLLVNSVSGKQTFIFPKGERIFPIEFSSLLAGNQNRYPFDSYTSGIDLLVTSPAQMRTEVLPKEDSEHSEDPSDPLATKLIVGSVDLEHSETVAIRETFSANIPGIKFAGTIAPKGTNKLTRTSLTASRAYNVMAVSMIIMTIMFGLAISVMGMVLKVAGSTNEINLLPLSLSISLIFGLPALRNVQPGVPGIGVISDYISFIWAEFIVSGSAIVLAWTWITRHKDKEG